RRASVASRLVILRSLPARGTPKPCFLHSRRRTDCARAIRPDDVMYGTHHPVGPHEGTPDPHRRGDPMVVPTAYPVQLIQPDGRRVLDTEYGPLVADVGPDELRGLYRDMVVAR